MKKFALILLVLLLVGCTGTRTDEDSGSQKHPQASTATSEETRETGSKSSGLPIVSIDTSGGKKVRVRVEIADDNFERMRGLMYRTALGESRGMLFVFPKEELLSFWMKNTSIPLSIAYIDSDGRITDILDMKPFDDKPPHYVSSEPVQYALEVNQGFFDEHGVKVGNKANLPE
jgi:uncharacterized membrane protein (UPF0127 family)